jgi:hypothetical protein
MADQEPRKKEESMLEYLARVGDIITAPVLHIDPKVFEKMINEISLYMSEQYPKIGYLGGKVVREQPIEHSADCSDLVIVKLTELFVPDQVYHDKHDVRNEAPYRLRVTDEGYASTIAEMERKRLKVAGMMFYNGRLHLMDPESIIQREKERLISNGIDVPAIITVSPGSQTIKVPYEVHVEPPELLEVHRF